MAHIIIDVEGTMDKSVYDMGFVVMEGDTVIESHNFIISEVWNDTARMGTAYYAEKMPLYGDVHPVPFVEAWRTFNAIVKRYHVRTVWAWNVKYDRSALNTTVRRLSNGFINSFCETVEWRDAWDYVASCYCHTVKYATWAMNNGFLTPKRYPSTSAETVYRYLFDDIDFTEDHMSLSDALIEGAMLAKARKCHKKAPETVGVGWRYTIQQ